MSFIDPCPEQIKRLIDSNYKGPIVMLNLLKFKLCRGSFCSGFSLTKPHIQGIHHEL
jgi:hypothetical protein